MKGPRGPIYVADWEPTFRFVDKEAEERKRLVAEWVDQHSIEAPVDHRYSATPARTQKPLLRLSTHKRAPQYFRNQATKYPKLRSGSPFTLGCTGKDERTGRVDVSMDINGKGVILEVMRHDGTGPPYRLHLPVGREVFPEGSESAFGALFDLGRAPGWAVKRLHSNGKRGERRRPAYKGHCLSTFDRMNNCLYEMGEENNCISDWEATKKKQLWDQKRPQRLENKRKALLKDKNTQVAAATAAPAATTDGPKTSDAKTNRGKDRPFPKVFAVFTADGWLAGALMFEGIDIGKPSFTWYYKHVK